MAWFAELRQELRARREGRRYVDNTITRPTRDITGPLGWAFSSTYEEVAKSGGAYNASFDRRIPPSLFVSERDRSRAGMPIPVVERCLEDFGTDVTDDPEIAAEVAEQ